MRVTRDDLALNSDSRRKRCCEARNALQLTYCSASVARIRILQVLNNIAEKQLQLVDTFICHGCSSHVSRFGSISRSWRRALLEHASVGRLAVPAVAGVVNVGVLR
jgi:hypothetical protein